MSAACLGKRSTKVRSSPSRAAPAGLGSRTTAPTSRGSAEASADTAPIAPAGHPVRDERLGPDEDVEPRKQVLLELGEGRVGDLEADDVVGGVPQALEDGRRDRVPGRRRELVDVERQRRARRRGGEEVRVLRLLVELEVRRADHDHRVRPDLRSVCGERHRVPRGLRAAVHGDSEAIVRRLEKEVCDMAPLVDTQKDPLPRRAEREDPIEARLDIEVAQRSERVVVGLAAESEQRRDRGGESSAERHQRCFLCRTPSGWASLGSTGARRRAATLSDALELDAELLARHAGNHRVQTSWPR